MRKNRGKEYLCASHESPKDIHFLVKHLPVQTTIQLLSEIKLVFILAFFFVLFFVFYAELKKKKKKREDLVDRMHTCGFVYKNVLS